MILVTYLLIKSHEYTGEIHLSSALLVYSLSAEWFYCILIPSLKPSDLKKNCVDQQLTHLDPTSHTCWNNTDNPYSKCSTKQ